MAKKAVVVERGTIFVLATDMVTADAWATAHRLGKDRYRYVVNPEVFDVMGGHDSYAVVAGYDTHPLHMVCMGIVRAKGLEWCEKDPHILCRDETGKVVRRPDEVDLYRHEYAPDPPKERKTVRKVKAPMAVVPEQEALL